MSRRAHNYTQEEIDRLLADRAKHPEMMLKDWAKANGIATSMFYRWSRKAAPTKRMGRPPGKKDSTPRKPSQPPRPKGNTESQLKEALAAIKHWRARASELAEQLIIESLTE